MEHTAFSDKIWTTRKTRMFTEKRLNRNDLLSKLLVTYYSLIIVAISIWDLLNHSTYLNLTIIFSTISILVYSVFLMSQKFSERSLEIRNCYINLDELCKNVIRAENSKDIKQTQQHESEYTKILQSVENHSAYDFLCLRFSLRNHKNTTLPIFYRTDYLNFIWSKFYRTSFFILLFITPIILVLFYILTKQNVSV